VLLELRDVEGARARIEGRVHLTPMMSSATVGDELGMRLHLKAELFQKTGSFKPRGVFNKLLSLDPGDLSRGLVSLSAGNHAAALAYGASSVGAKATIVMPVSAMQSKIEATRRYGGEVVQTEGSLLDACLALQQERDLACPSLR
jgi:threonine dehydratase